MSIFDEEGPRPRSQQRFVPPPTLDGWDIEALRGYIEALRAEILRAEAAIARQEGHRSAADSFFRKPQA